MTSEGCSSIFRKKQKVVTPKVYRGKQRPAEIKMRKELEGIVW